MRSRSLPIITLLLQLQWNSLSLIIRYFFLSFSTLIVSVFSAYAADDKWIDGIKIRAMLYEAKSYILVPEFDNDKLVKPPEGNEAFFSAESEYLFPVVITFPETLINSWSSRAFFLIFNWKTQFTIYSHQVKIYGKLVDQDAYCILQKVSVWTVFHTL